MKIIRKAAIAQSNSLGIQKIDINKNYRPFTYSMSVRCEDGLLLYNNLTDELILLNADDENAIKCKDFSSDIFTLLIKKWFFVPKENDDANLCNQINNFMHLLVDTYGVNQPITQYTILTTTDCNARCFYCYEMGRKRINMTPKIANDVADYIIKSCNGEKVTFRWFGGEPLCNSIAIDIICNKLTDSGIEYQSGMVSNGYLFDEVTIKNGIENWNLKQVQITLDGTEDVYNRCKAFIHDDPSPYQRVMRNIKLLLDYDVFVKIRMNADRHNMDDLFNLTDVLYEKFSEYSNMRVYSHLIFENTGNNFNRDQKEQREIFNRHNDLLKYINEKGFITKATLHNYLRYQQCMADNPSATVITPDGHLGRCEHFSENEFWGSIYSNEIDYGTIKRFKKVRVLPQSCDNCPVKPACIHLEMCPDTPQKCTDYIQESYINNTRGRMINTYIEYKTGIKQSTDLWD